MPTHPSPLVRRIESLFAAFAAPGMPGGSVLVTRDGSVLVRRAFGLADADAGILATPRTNYRLASLSKPFTAMAVMLLAADGMLDIDDTATRFLPELPAFARGVSLRHLLTHTSGLPDYEPLVPGTQARQVTDADVLALLAAQSDRLHFAPGSEWRYSNTGYALLALAVERASGRRYGDLLKARIFDPLGMANTVAHEEGRTTVVNRAYGHRVRGGTVLRADQSPTSAVLGDGGIYSSIDDLARWDAALWNGAFVPAALWREATTPFVLTDGRATAYGHGWFIETAGGLLRWRHHGETRGFTNICYRIPGPRLTVVVLTNRSDAAPWVLADRIVEMLCGRT